MTKKVEAVAFPLLSLPPWYRTYWAYLSYLLLALVLVYGTVKLNTQRLHSQNEHLEKLIFERTSEIWEQHKVIVKKTVALKRQKEEVAAQHQLLAEKNGALKGALRQLKDAQAQLVQSEKMASLGQLTAGIAHEINNPDQFCKRECRTALKRDFSEIRLLFRRMLELKASNDLKMAVEKIHELAPKSWTPNICLAEMEQLLHGIEEGAIRTANIVKGLKSFARTGDENFHYINISECIDSTLIILANKLKNRILVEKDYGQIPMVECMPGKINQVFMNVISNAIQAMENQPCGSIDGLEEPYIGRLSIKTETTEDGMAGIRISDSGCGISKEIQDRIFEPFFTTKDVGAGTGLGLSITFGIIEKTSGKNPGRK